MELRSKLLSASVVAMAAMVGQPALASVVVTTSLTDNIPPSAVLLNFNSDDVAPANNQVTPSSPIHVGDATVTFAPGSFLVKGGEGDAAAPITGESGTTAVKDTDVYLSAEVKAPITLSFSKAQKSFELLWGSIDTHNSLSFYDCVGGGTACGAEYTLTGSGVTADPNGFQGFGGSSYVNISGLVFNTVVATDTTSPAFEFDFVSTVAAGTPEPASWMMMFIGLGALGFMMRGSRRTGALGVV